MEHNHEILANLAKPTRELRQHIPGVFDAYAAFGKAVFIDGALDAKTKELIALAISVSKQCDGCMASHGRGAARQGATAEEVAEALGVAIMMNGGPGVVQAPRAYEAFLELSPDQDA